MSGGMVLGALLALVALGFVLFPVVKADAAVRVKGAGPSRPDEGEDAIAALREVEFDRATGKLSDEDYATLTARYRPRALAQLEREARDGQAARDPEAMVAEWRAREASCPTCGPRPEAGATWCSSCGRYLPERCPRCAEAVTEDGASFCARCGVELARA
jgi:hypothetical protein